MKKPLFESGELVGSTWIVLRIGRNGEWKQEVLGLGAPTPGPLAPSSIIRLRENSFYAIKNYTLPFCAIENITFPCVPLFYFLDPFYAIQETPSGKSSLVALSIRMTCGPRVPDAHLLSSRGSPSLSQLPPARRSCGRGGQGRAEGARKAETLMADGHRARALSSNRAPLTSSPLPLLSLVLPYLPSHAPGPWSPLPSGHPCSPLLFSLRRP